MKYFSTYTRILNSATTDGIRFIHENVKEGLLSWFRNEDLQKCGRIHIAMNLPASATQFLSAFVAIFREEDSSTIRVLDESTLPLIHVYAFSQTDNHKNDLKAECEKELGKTLKDINISFVRNVAPQKDMFRITIPLDLDILSGSNKLGNNNESKSKRQKLDL